MLVSEQGIGRGLEPLTTAVNLFGGKTGGNSWTTYGPAPLFVAATPATTCSDDASDDCTVAYRALVLEDGPHGEAPVAVFDSSTDHSIIAIGVWGTSMVARVLYAPTATTA